jgi:hypothetical protein
MHIEAGLASVWDTIREGRGKKKDKGMGWWDSGMGR